MKFESYLSSRFLWKSSPISGPFDWGKLPYLRAIAQSLDNGANEIAIGAANSTGKTLISAFFVEWASQFVPGNMLIYAQGDDEAKSNWLNDYEPFFKNHPLMKKITRRVVQGSVEFVTGEYVRCFGANPGNANGFQVTKIAGTEVHLWPDGILSAVKKRTGGAGRFDRMILLDSTRGRMEGDFEREISGATGGRWHVRCPHCAALFDLTLLDPSNLSRFSGVLRFDADANPRAWEAPGGVEIVCPSCPRATPDGRGIRRDMSALGDYVFERPGAAGQSFSWPALAASWNPAHAEIAEYFRARDALKYGNQEVMRDFLKKREAFADTGEMPSADGFSAIFAPGFENAKKRTLTIDVQGTGGLHFWAMVANLSNDGQIHVLEFCKLQTWEQVREMQIRWGVKWNFVGVDVKWAHLRSSVLERCALWGWYAMGAFPQASFQHKDGKALPWNNPDKSLACARTPEALRSRAETRKLNADKVADFGMNIAKRSPLFAYELRWSKPFFHGLFQAIKKSPALTLGNGIKAQAELQKQIVTTTEGADHAADCLQMSLVLAMRQGVNFSSVEVVKG